MFWKDTFEFILSARRALNCVLEKPSRTSCPVGFSRGSPHAGGEGKKVKSSLHASTFGIIRENFQLARPAPLTDTPVRYGIFSDTLSRPGRIKEPLLLPMARFPHVGIRLSRFPSLQAWHSYKLPPCQYESLRPACVDRNPPLRFWKLLRTGQRDGSFGEDMGKDFGPPRKSRPARSSALTAKGRDQSRK